MMKKSFVVTVDWYDYETMERVDKDEIRNTLIEHLQSEFEMWSPDVEVVLIGEVK
jgi:hypothetical protein